MICCGRALVAKSQSSAGRPSSMSRIAPPTIQVSNPASSSVRQIQRTWSGGDTSKFIRRVIGQQGGGPRCGSPSGPFRKMAVDTLTDGVSDREVQFLRTGNSLGGNYEGEIHFLP